MGENLKKLTQHHFNVFYHCNVFKKDRITHFKRNLRNNHIKMNFNKSRNFNLRYFCSLNHLGVIQ